MNPPPSRRRKPDTTFRLLLERLRNANTREVVDLLRELPKTWRCQELYNELHKHAHQPQGNWSTSPIVRLRQNASVTWNDPRKVYVTLDHLPNFENITRIHEPTVMDTYLKTLAFLRIANLADHLHD